MQRVRLMNKVLLNTFLLLVTTVVCSSGCTMAPKYSRPEAPVPAAWPSGSSYEQASATAGAVAANDIPWRKFIVDERLRKIIATALENNRDLRIAALHVERVRPLYGIQRSELLPTIN